MTGIAGRRRVLVIEDEASLFAAAVQPAGGGGSPLMDQLGKISLMARSERLALLGDPQDWVQAGTIEEFCRKWSL